MPIFTVILKTHIVIYRLYNYPVVSPISYRRKTVTETGVAGLPDKCSVSLARGSWHVSLKRDLTLYVIKIDIPVFWSLIFQNIQRITWKLQFLAF